MTLPPVPLVLELHDWKSAYPVIARTKRSTSASSL